MGKVAKTTRTTDSRPAAKAESKSKSKRTSPKLTSPKSQSKSKPTREQQRAKAAPRNASGGKTVTAASSTVRRPEPSAPRRARALLILDSLKDRFPDAKIELAFDEHDPWQLLVAVVLSAQSTDVGVNKATPALFGAFPNVQAFARASPEDVEPYIKTLGLYRNKAKSVVGAARRVVDEFGGQVPSERAVLETLPGVGPKSAAVIVANCFGQPAIAVDTHVGRVTRRMGLTPHTDPGKVEADLTELLPRDRLLEAHHTFIWHGRRICHARRPACAECPIERLCHKVDVERGP